jgi:hypothetical protein
MHELSLLCRFNKSFTTELRLLVAHWGYALLHLAWMALLLGMFFGKDVRSAQALLETSLGRLAIGLISLAGLFLAGLSASRAQRSRFIDMEASFPIGFEITAGRWLAGVLALCLLLIEPVGIAALRGPLSSLLAGLPFFIGEAVLTIAFTTAFAWALVAWFQPGRWVYPLLAAGWLAFLLGPSILTGMIPSTSLLNFMRQGVSFYSELWGRLVYGAQPVWFNLFYTGLLLAALGLAALRVHLRRFHRPLVWVGALLLVAFAASGLGGTRYIGKIQAVQAGGSKGAAVSASAPFTVEAYDITMDLNSSVLPRFVVELAARNTSEAALEELIFTLNPALTITDAGVVQEGELVRVRLEVPLAPDANTKVTLHYQGAPRIEVLEEGVVEATNFIDLRGVRLTPQAAWYPVPNGRSSAPGLHNPAKMQIRVLNPGNLRFGANLPPVGENTFAAEGVQWVFLAGSPHLVLEQIGENVLVTSQTELPRARQLLDDFARPLPMLTRFFPDVPLRGLVLMVLGEESGLPEGTPPSAGYPVVVLPAYRLSAVSYEELNVGQLHTIVEALITDVWRLGGGPLDPREGRVSGLQMAFDQSVTFLTKYLWNGGDGATMQADFQSLFGPSTKNTDSTYQALLDIYSAQGDAGVIRALAQMRVHGAELRDMPYDALPGWVRQAAQAEAP